MDFAIPNSARLRKACVPCRSQKLRCNAKDVGLPCSRCQDRLTVSQCVLSPRRQRPRKRNQQTQSLAQQQPTSVGGCSTDLGPRIVDGQAEPYTVADTEQNSRAISNQVFEDMRQEDAALSQAVSETQTHLQLCLELSNGHKLLSSSDLLDSHSGREVVHYHSHLDFVSILGELMSQSRLPRLLRIVVSDQDDSSTVASLNTSTREGPCGLKVSTHNLSEGALGFLLSESVFEIPPKRICDELLSLYFRHSHHYTPVVDPAEFVDAYFAGRASLFLLYTIFAAVLPCVPNRLILEAGFISRFAAQKTFLSRATHLYNFGCEKSRLRLLQASLILTTTTTNYGSHCDVNYWMHSALRLSITMGFHRRHTADSLDESMRRLCHKIWWLVSSREALFGILGLKSSRIRVHPEHDLSPLTMSDCDETVPRGRLQRIVSPVTVIQKQYIVQMCHLARIGSEIMLNLEQLERTHDRSVDWTKSISKWRERLPAEIQLSRIQKWSPFNVCLLVMLGASYRIECIMYRALKKHCVENGHTGSIEWGDLLFAALFELETIIGRVMAHDLIQYTTLLFVNCVSTTVALRIEVALTPNSPEIQKSIARTSIQSGLLFLRRAKDYWQNVESPLKLLEWVVSRKNLGLVDETSVSGETSDILSSVSPFPLFDGQTPNGTNSLASDPFSYLDEFLDDASGSNFAGQLAGLGLDSSSWTDLGL